MAHRDLEREERAIYAIIAAASAPVVIAFAIRGGVFDGGTTLSLGLVFLGLLGLVTSVRMVKSSFPSARVIDRASRPRRGRAADSLRRPR